MPVGAAPISTGGAKSSPLEERGIKKRAKPGQFPSPVEMRESK